MRNKIYLFILIKIRENLEEKGLPLENKINLMLLSRNMNEERTLIDSMKSLVVTDYLAEEMFKIL